MATHEMTVAAQNVTCLRITSHSGRVEVSVEDRTDILVLGDHASAQTSVDGTLTLSSVHGASTIGIRCPAGLNFVVGTASGKIMLKGEVGDVRATSHSGSIEVESARSADLRSQSGDVSIGRCEAGCRVQTASGSVHVGTAASAEVATQSGKVNVSNACGKARVRTASGRVDVGATGEGDIAIDTMSGGVTVRLPAGTRPAASLYGITGRTHCELASGSDCRVAVRSMNGKIEVVSA